MVNMEFSHYMNTAPVASVILPMLLCSYIIFRVGSSGQHNSCSSISLGDSLRFKNSVCILTVPSSLVFVGFYTVVLSPLSIVDPASFLILVKVGSRIFLSFIGIILVVVAITLKNSLFVGSPVETLVGNRFLSVGFSV